MTRRRSCSCRTPTPSRPTRSSPSWATCPCSAGSPARARSTAARRCSAATRSCPTARWASRSAASTSTPPSRRARRRSGPEMTITAAEGHMIQELAGRPALTALRDASRRCPRASASRSPRACCSACVVDQGKPEFERGDFLVRGAARRRPRHRSARRRRRRRARAGRAPARTRCAAAPTRTCSEVLGARAHAVPGRAAGRSAGVHLQRPRARHVRRGRPRRLAVDAALAGAPVAGFFAAGEIGPVGGAPSCMASRPRWQYSARDQASGRTHRPAHRRHGRASATRSRARCTAAARS